MAESWDSYICNVNGAIASIFLNLSLFKTAPDPARPCLLFVWVKMKSPGPDGLSSQQEADDLWKLDDKLTAELERELNAVFAGRITTQGRREFYFYVPQAPENNLAVDRALASFSKYRYETGVQADPTWGQFLTVLYPSGEELQKMKNRQVVEVLRKNGDTLDEPRKVSHWIYFKSEAGRGKFCKAMRELGYEILPCPNAKNHEVYVFGVQIRKLGRVDQESIDSDVLEIVRFAEAVDGEYDGWETEVVRPPGSFKSFLRRLGFN